MTQDLTVGDEDPREFEAFRAELWRKHRPADGLESVLLDSLARTAWRLGRVPSLEAMCFGLMPNFDNSVEFNRRTDFLFKLTRYETALRNGFNRTLQQFLALQQLRRAEEERQATVNVIPPPPDDDAPKADASSPPPRSSEEQTVQHVPPVPANDDIPLD